MKLSRNLATLSLLGLMALPPAAFAVDPPAILNHQGRIAVDGVNLGTPTPVTGYFKFALVNGDASQTYWTNSPDTTPADGVPDTAVGLTVDNGHYAVGIGDTGVTGMTAVPVAVFGDHDDVHLRIWFSSDNSTFNLLSPDRRITSAGYALNAATAQSIPNDSVTSAMLQDGAVTAGKLGTNAVGTANIANGAVTAEKIAPGVISGGPGGSTPVVVTGTEQMATPNTTQVATSGSLTHFYLPPDAASGDLIDLVGSGSGGWVAYEKWQQLPMTTNGRAVVCSEDGSKVVASVSGAVRFSQSGGLHWADPENGVFGTVVDLAMSADGWRIAAAVDGAHIHVSDDQGGTWSPRPNSGSRAWVAVASSETGEILAAAEHGGSIHVSNDFGATWTERAGDQDRRYLALTMSANGTVMFAAALPSNPPTPDSSTLYMSTNSGVSWAPLDPTNAAGHGGGTPAEVEWTGVDCSSDGMRVVAVGDGRVYTSTDGGQNWTLRIEQAFGKVSSSDDGMTLIAESDDFGSQRTVYLSLDGGSTWEAQDTTLTTTAGGKRFYEDVAISGDGKRVFAAANGHPLVSNRPGLIASGAGPGATTARFNFDATAGWKVLGETKIADGAVSMGTIAPAFYRGQTGGMETFDFSSPAMATTTVTFDRPFQSVPQIDIPGWTVTSANGEGFMAEASFEPGLADSAGDVGFDTSLAVLTDGCPAISYYDVSNGDLKFVKANDPDATTWTIPVVIDSTDNVGQFSSLAVIGGRPAISYYDATNDDLRYVVANDSQGNTWAPPVVVDAEGDVGQFTSLAVVQGRPAISYFSDTNEWVKYAIAPNANGSGAWTYGIVATNSNITSTSLAVVDGFPAVAYWDAVSGELKFAVAGDGIGNTWPPPVQVPTGGVIGMGASLALVNGRPAVGFDDTSNGSIRFVIAQDARGAAWEVPVLVDAQGNMLGHLSLITLNGRPAMSYYDGTDLDLKFAQSVDSQGRAWAAPIAVATGGDVGAYPSLASVGGRAAISYYDANKGDLLYARLPPMNAWTAQDASGSPVIAARATGVVDHSVTNAGLAFGSVSSEKILNGAVGADALAFGAVNSLKIEDGSITASDLGGDIGLWSVNGGTVYRSAGKVSIGTSTPASGTDLTVQAGPGNAPGGISLLQSDGSEAGALGIPASNGHFSSSAIAGDLVIRSRNGRLHLQSGSDHAALTVSGDNHVGVGMMTPDEKLTVAGNVKCTTIIITSDRDQKTGFEPIDTRSVLDKVAGMPISRWHYTSDEKSTPHVGPMAQDFHAAFGVGPDERHITTVDADGVALAAIQALKEMVDEKDAKIEALEKRLEALEKHLSNPDVDQP